MKISSGKIYWATCKLKISRLGIYIFHWVFFILLKLRDRLGFRFTQRESYCSRSRREQMKMKIKNYSQIYYNLLHSVRYLFLLYNRDCSQAVFVYTFGNVLWFCVEYHRVVSSFFCMSGSWIEHKKVSSPISWIRFSFSPKPTPF